MFSFLVVTLYIQTSFQVTLIAGLNHNDAVYVSHGHFKADCDGYINLLHTPSTGGTYRGV